MKPNLQQAQLTYFLQEELYLFKTDVEYYRNPRPAAIELAEPVLVPIETPAPAFKYMGNRENECLILTYYPDAELMTDAHLTALTSTLARLPFNINDTAIVNMAIYPETDWAQLLDFFDFKRLLILGEKALPSGIETLPFNQIHAAESYRALYTFSFQEMIGQKENTKIFWNQIKSL